MASSSQAQTAVGVLILAAIYLGLMLIQALVDKGDPRCGEERSYLNPSCQEAATYVGN